MDFLCVLVCVICSVCTQDELPMEDLLVVSGGEVVIVDENEVIHVQDPWFYEIGGMTIVADGEGTPVAGTYYLPGDVNLDGSVECADFTTLATNFGN